MGNFEEKKSVQQDYNLTPIYMITESFQTKNCSDFCTANQSTNTNLRNYFDFLRNLLFLKTIKMRRQSNYYTKFKNILETPNITAYKKFKKITIPIIINHLYFFFLPLILTSSDKRRKRLNTEYKIPNPQNILKNTPE